jgi:hypothetical protein
LGKGKNRSQDSGFGIQGVNNPIPGGRRWVAGGEEPHPTFDS